MFNGLFKNAKTRSLALISSGNLIQQFFSVISIFCLIKLYGANEYAGYILIIAQANLFYLVIAPINNPFILREGSREFEKNKSINKSLTISLIFIPILILLLIIVFLMANKYFFYLNYNYILPFILFLIATVSLNLSKIIFRVIDNMKSYFIISIFEKIILFIVIILSYFFFQKIENILTLYSLIILLSIGIYFIKFKINFRPNKIRFEEVKDFFASVKFIYLSTILFFFVNQDYLILKINHFTNDNLIISTIGLGFVILSFVFFPIFWLEQHYTQKFYKNSLENISFFLKGFTKEFSNNVALIMILIKILLIIIIQNTEIVKILDDNFHDYKNYLIIILFLILNNSLDTTNAIIMYSLKKEKIIFLCLIIKLLIFTYALFSENLIGILNIFILISYLQNLIIILFLKFKYKYFNTIEFYLIIYTTLVLQLYLLNLTTYFNIFLFIGVILTLLILFKKRRSILKLIT